MRTSSFTPRFGFTAPAVEPPTLTLVKTVQNPAGDKFVTQTASGRTITFEVPNPKQQRRAGLEKRRDLIEQKLLNLTTLSRTKTNKSNRSQLPLGNDTDLSLPSFPGNIGREELPTIIVPATINPFKTVPVKNKPPYSVLDRVMRSPNPTHPTMQVLNP